MSAPLKVFMIAGEASGDRLGGALLAGLHGSAKGGVSVTGIGGPEMAAQGLTSRFPMEELSVMGLAEVLPKYFHLKRRIEETAAAVLADPPDVLITIDSPDFCLRVARKVKAVRPGQHVVHYVAPSVWAWRPKRALKMVGVVDQVLALLPFEPPYMEAVGLRCDFVGHPVVAEPAASDAEAAAFRVQHGIAEAAPLVAALPGSRKGEVARLGPVLGEALHRAATQVPGFRVVVPTLPNVAEAVTELARDWPGDPVILSASGPEKRAAFASADAALAVSGTVSLELAAARTPMVIAYNVAWLTRQIVRHMLKIETFTLVNLVSETRAVPEFIAENCKPGPISEALVSVLQGAPDQLSAMDVTMQRLGRGQEAPGVRAARAVLNGLAN